MTSVLIIGIAGGSGSGKSTLVRALEVDVGSAYLAVLPHDAYYRDGRVLPRDARGERNWDDPDALDNDLLAQHVDDLTAGKAVQRPTYDFATHSRTTATVLVEPRRVVIVEGVLVLALPELRRRFGLAVYVDTPAEERLARRVQRDVAERGRTVDSVLEQFRATVRPMHEAHVEPSKRHAHVVVPWDRGVDQRPAVALLSALVRTRAEVHR
jgi:uridine kinase